MLDHQDVGQHAGFMAPAAFTPASMFLWFGVMGAVMLACNSMIAMSYARR